MNDERAEQLPETPVARRRGAAFFTTAALTLATLLFLLWSAERLPLTWDEGDAFTRAERVAEWFNALRLGPEYLRTTDFVTKAPEGQRRELRRYFATLASRRALFAPDALEVGFQHAIYREGHPSGYTLTIASGNALARAFGVAAFFSEKTALRFGGILLFTIAVFAVYWRTADVFGRLLGVAAALGALSCPRVFCHALIAGGDSLLISSWMLAWAFFPAAKRSCWGAVLWGWSLGISFSAKFSGFLIVAPFFVVFCLEQLFFRSKRPEAFRVLLRLALGVAAGLTFFMAVNPTLWHDPIRGLLTFWTLNTQRDGFNIPIWFFGRLCSMTRPLPWWNGFFWVVATVPSVLTFMALGTLAVFAKNRSAAAKDDGKRASLVLTALAMGLTLPVTRAFPGLPTHDGARLLVASVVFWGILGGLGAGLAARWFSERFRKGKTLVGVVTLSLLLAPGIVDMLLIAPQYLSFYSAFVGGLGGAAKAGLEPTYYWDSFDSGVAEELRVLAARARDDGRPSGILFSSFSSQTLEYYRRWNILPFPEVATISNPAAQRDLTPYGFYVLQRRPGILTAFDFVVIKNAEPTLTKSVRDPLPNPFCFGRRDTIVLEVYEMGELFASP